ncbi:MAG: ATP-dependent zinc protease family protein [Gammaproteobacteria bacterium]
MTYPIRLTLSGLAIGLLLAPTAHGQVTVGCVEKVRVEPGDLVLKAKVDTGAKHSSLNARHIREINRDGERWYASSSGIREAIEWYWSALLKRRATIERHFGKQQTRPVVELGLCMGTLYKTVEVNLVNRMGFIYPMLIGRSFLTRDIAVDPSRTFIHRPDCEPEAAHG